MELLLQKIIFLFLLLELKLDKVDAAFAPLVCKKYEWACDEGSCINAAMKCNGAVDCPDGSDETFLLCRNTKCSGFRCLYGGCVAANATCDGVKDCADNSDELIFKCRNESTYSECVDKISYDAPDNLERWQNCKLIWRTCKNGQVLDNYQKCDGRFDCEDGSDETLETCATDQRHCQGLAFGPKFRCNYGACIDQSAVCDGVIDCADGSDELHGLCYENNTNEWECDDGTIINAAMKCNGAVDCPDGSDETFLTCRNNECPVGFRCVYGGCIRNSAICDGVRDCRDNSDELLTKCRNQQTYTECYNKIRWLYITNKDLLERSQICNDLDKLCDDGQKLRSMRFKCDGRVHCADGSDESFKNCATDRHNCHVMGDFRCQHGGCVDKSKVCNRINDCADGSDELDGICNVGKCLLPDYPPNGHYAVLDKPKASPGQDLKSALLIYSCGPGYTLNAESPYVSCSNGSWVDEKLHCLAQCYLKKDPSITYWCSKDLSIEKTECEELVPEGVTVLPKCREPNYHYAGGVLTDMHCVGGNWDRQVPTCVPYCGLVSSQGDTLIVNGTTSKLGELPWHAAIYKKPLNSSYPYQQICGGSLITNTVIISAAHCFWKDRLLPAERFAAALGKIYRPWNNVRDANAQKSDIKKIITPEHFHGWWTNFQDDIAIVVLASAVEYGPNVRPVCLDFNPDFERRQLTDGAVGKVTGWGLTAEDGRSSPVLKVTELSYVENDRCYRESPPSFYLFITSDKFCASNSNHSTVCQGDSGGGLVFPSREHNSELYYLRGVVSTKPKNNHKCNTYAHTTFTSLGKHQDFIQKHWNCN